MRFKYASVHGYDVGIMNGLLYGMSMVSQVSRDEKDIGLYIKVEEFRKMKAEKKPREIVKILEEVIEYADEYYTKVMEDEERQIIEYARTRESKEEKRPPEFGHVYIIKTSIGVKIGISNNGKVQGRIKAYTSTPFEIYETRVYDVYNFRCVEQSLHDYFADKRTKGEWFNLTDEDIQAAENIIIIDFNATKHNG